MLASHVTSVVLDRSGETGRIVASIAPEYVVFSHHFVSRNEHYAPSIPEIVTFDRAFASNHLPEGHSACDRHAPQSSRMSHPSKGSPSGNPGRLG